MYLPELQERLIKYLKNKLKKFIVLDWQKYYIKYFNERFWESIRKGKSPNTKNLGIKISNEIFSYSIRNTIDVLEKLIDDFDFHMYNSESKYGN